MRKLKANTYLIAIKFTPMNATVSCRYTRRSLSVAERASEPEASYIIVIYSAKQNSDKMAKVLYRHLKL